MARTRTSSFLHAFLSDFIDARRRHGTARAIGGIADRLASKVIGLNVSHVFAFDLQKLTSTEPDSSGFTCRFLTPDEIRVFSADPSNELTADLADRAAAGHDLCFGVQAGARLAGYGWCALNSIEPEHTGGIALSFPSHVGYMYKGFTHPDFRGRGLNGLRVVLAGHALAERGLRKLICLVDWANWASIQSCRHGGCEELGSTVTFQIAGRRFWFIPDAARQLGLQFGERAATREAPRSGGVAIATA
jgi:ribosomal protein S18 acetylase RimI-like enzyme